MPDPAISAALGAMPGRFHLGFGRPEGSTPLSDLWDEPALAGWLHREATRVGTTEHQVAASMLLQQVAMVLGGATLAALMLQDRLVLASPQHIHVSTSERPRWAFSAESAQIRCVEPGERAEALAAWVQHWVDGVFEELLERIRRLGPVGRRMLRDDVASAAVGNLVFLDWWDPSCGALAAAETLLGLGQEPIGASVTLRKISHAGREGLASNRRSCCLMFQTEPPRWCPTCPRLDEAARDHEMRTHLVHLDHYDRKGSP